MTPMAAPKPEREHQHAEPAGPFEQHLAREHRAERDHHPATEQPAGEADITPRTSSFVGEEVQALLDVRNVCVTFNRWPGSRCVRRDRRS